MSDDKLDDCDVETIRKLVSFLKKEHKECMFVLGDEVNEGYNLCLMMIKSYLEKDEHDAE